MKGEMGEEQHMPGSLARSLPAKLRLLSAGLQSKSIFALFPHFAAAGVLNLYMLTVCGKGSKKET